MVNFSKFIAIALIIHNVAVGSQSVDDHSLHARLEDQQGIHQKYPELFRRGCSDNGVGCGSTIISLTIN
jgi:hypothetical protein